MDIHKEIGARIQRLRNQKNISGDTLGQHLGITRSAVSLIETGRTKTSTEQLLIISKLLDVSVAYLIGEEESKMANSNTDVVGLKQELEATKKELSWAKSMIRILDKDKLVQVDEILGKLESSWRKATFSTFGG